MDHSSTAPSTIRRNLFPENKEAAYSRSMTEKWWTQSWIPRHELKLDRLSEREKVSIEFKSSKKLDVKPLYLRTKSIIIL